MKRMKEKIRTMVMGLRKVIMIGLMVIVSVGEGMAAINGDVFERISSVGAIEDGNEIIFVNQAETYACGTTQNTNNRTPVAITTSSHKYTYNTSDNVQVFVVKITTIEGKTRYGFHTGSGYIYSASASNNYLRTSSTDASIAPAGVMAWSMAVSDYVFTIMNHTNTSYYLQFYGTSTFSQYTGGQKSPYIYKKVDASCEEISPVVEYSGTELRKGERASVTGITGNSGDATVSYISSDETVISVDEETGEVTALKAGSATVTATFAASGDYCAAEVETAFTVAYSVNWMVNGAAYDSGSPTESVGTHGGKVTTLPTEPTPPDYADSKEFAGWTDTEYSHATDAPTVLFASAETAPTVTDNVTYYAVFGDVVSAAKNTVLWSEDFTGYAGGDTPIEPNMGEGYGATVYGGADVGYGWQNGTGTGATTTRVYNENSVGTARPEVLVAGTGTGGTGGFYGAAGLPTGGAQVVRVRYKQNANRLYVFVTGEGYSGSKNDNTAGEKTLDVTVGSDETFALTFQATTTNNVRLDDINVSVLTPSYARYATRLTEAEVVEWGQHSIVVEVDATGIGASKVQARLNGEESELSSLVQTGSSQGGATKYDYTIDLGEDIDLADGESYGKKLVVEWLDGSDAIVGVSEIRVPKIIAADGSMSELMADKTAWETEVHVLPGVTLTADAGEFDGSEVTISKLEVYPGARVAIETGTLDATEMVLRNGWSRAEEKRYDVAQVYIDPEANMTHTNAYSDWYIDYDQYYPIAVPFPVATSSIAYRNTSSSASSGVKIRSYDGAARASSGQMDQDDNWVEYSWGETMPSELEPSKGYAITAKRPSGKAFAIVRMPLSFSDAWTTGGEQGEVSGTHKNQVTVTAYGQGTAPWYAMGWNFIGNPYMSAFNGDDEGLSGKIAYAEGGSIRYATIPSVDFRDYEQVNIREARLKPSSAFFVQGSYAEGATAVFSTSQIIAPTAPQWRAETQPMTEQEAYIQLEGASGKDQMGLIVGEGYSAEYEANADLAKIVGEAQTVKTYMVYGGMEMAYVAVDETLAAGLIPVTVRLPEDGSYTFSLNGSSIVDGLMGVYLTDYVTGETTNLMDEDYAFMAQAGTWSERFALNAVVGEEGGTTGYGLEVMGDGVRVTGYGLRVMGAEKFIREGRLYIRRDGRVFDGKGYRL